MRRRRGGRPLWLGKGEGEGEEWKGERPDSGDTAGEQMLSCAFWKKGRGDVGVVGAGGGGIMVGSSPVILLGAEVTAETSPATS